MGGIRFRPPFMVHPERACEDRRRARSPAVQSGGFHPHGHGEGHCGNHGKNGAGCCHGAEVENKDVEILGLLLDHWVAHNQDHAMEYNTWVEKMNRLGKNDVAESLIEAIALMREADKHLVEAKKELS